MTAAWDFTAPFAGSFEVEVLQACGKGSAGAEVDVTIGSQKLSLTIVDTGHFQRFVPRTIGSVRLDAGPQHLEVRARNKPGPAVMDLRRVVLRAAP
jgi:arylsulfatase A